MTLHILRGALSPLTQSFSAQVVRGPVFRFSIGPSCLPQTPPRVPASHPLAGIGRAPTLIELSRYPLVSYESSIRPESSLRRAFAVEGVEPQLAMTARDADLIKTYVRTGMGVGLLAEMALGAQEEADLVVLPAPAAIPECIAWAVLPRSRVSRDYALELIHAIAPQVDRHDVRRVLEGNAEADWPLPPTWIELTQTLTL